MAATPPNPPSVHSQDVQPAPTMQPDWSEARRAAEAQYHAEVEQNLKRNFAANLAHGLLGQTGFRLVTAPTFVPA